MGRAHSGASSMTPLKAKKPCAQFGCGAVVQPPARHCERHVPAARATDTRYEQRRNSTEYRKAYRSARWADFKRRFVPAQDGQCQRLDEWDGTRCVRAIDALHHLKHPEQADGSVNYDLMYDPANIVGTCNLHHRGGQKATPANVGVTQSLTSWTTEHYT